ncbi:MAG: hypothetical protein H0U23_03205 [Blastocatellia bacterium]|nr:hypothetical protein [Blastocatellia bacterium]
MKICAVSPFEDASREEILDFIAERQDDLVLLPGCNWYSPSATPALEDIQRVIRPNVSVFVEVPGERAIPYVVTKANITPMPPQVFKQGPDKKEFEEFLRVLPKRLLAIGSKEVVFVVCGEIDAFRPDGTLKFPGHFPDYDVLANPTHTLRGHWNYLGAKLEKLSTRGMTLHVTNNSKNRSGITTNVRIYKNGVRQPGPNERGKMAWCESDA